MILPGFTTSVYVVVVCIALLNHTHLLQLMIAGVYPLSSDNNMYKIILFFHIMGLCLVSALSLSSLSAAVIKVGMMIFVCFFFAKIITRYYLRLQSKSFL